MRLATCLSAVASLVAALPARPLAQNAPPPPRVMAPAPSAPPAFSPPPASSAPAAPSAPAAAAAPRAPTPSPGVSTAPRSSAPYPGVSAYPRAPAPGPRYPGPYHSPYAFPYYPYSPYFYSPFYFSFGWSWGWYPFYGYPAYPAYPAYPGYPPGTPPAPGQMPMPPPEDRIYTRFSLYGAGRANGYMGGFAFALDSRYFGFDFDLAALASEHVTGPLFKSGSEPATLVSGHVTWSVLSTRSARLRLEGGLTVLDLPQSTAVAGAPWRGNTLIGPDFGLSGHLGLIGPVAVEGHALFTPYPQRIGDVFGGFAFHAGPLGLTAGWRWVDVAGNGVDAPKLSFSGPQLGFALAF